MFFELLQLADWFVAPPIYLRHRSANSYMMILADQRGAALQLVAASCVSEAQTIRVRLRSEIPLVYFLFIECRWLTNWFVRPSMPQIWKCMLNIKDSDITTHPVLWRFAAACCALVNLKRARSVSF